MKKLTLTAAQQKIIDKMKEGWKLSGGTFSGFELRKLNDRNQFDSITCNASTLFSLKEKGLIKQSSDTFATTTEFTLA